MEIKTKFKPGQIVWVKARQPFKFLIVLVVVDEQEQPMYCGGRNLKEDAVFSENQLQENKPTLVLPQEP